MLLQGTALQQFFLLIQYPDATISGNLAFSCEKKIRYNLRVTSQLLIR